jgi:hypothetical protein
VIDADNYRIGNREKIMFCLYDTFNNCIISRHRTVEAAQKADDKLQDSFRNGSYLPTQIRKIINGEAVWIDTKQQDAEDDYRNYGIDADDDAIIDAVLEADLCSPEQVCDVVLAVANAGGDWRAELDKAIANDSVEAE